MIRPNIFKKILDQGIALSEATGAVHNSMHALSFYLWEHPTYVPIYFKPQEFVSEEVYNSLKMQSWMLMDSRILWTADALREWFGAAIKVNTWASGGVLDERGFRLRPLKARYGPHIYGRAMDFNVWGVDDAEVQKRIRSGYGKEPALRYISRMEDNTEGWTHIDCVNTGTDELTIFKGA